jgi:hypothetical protein
MSGSLSRTLSSPTLGGSQEVEAAGIYEGVSAPRLRTVSSQRNLARSSLGAGQRIRESQLDEGLTRHADAPGFAIDRAKQVDRKVDVDALDFAAGTTSLLMVGATGLEPVTSCV